MWELFGDNRGRKSTILVRQPYDNGTANLYIDLVFGLWHEIEF